mgnify:CR=1 FL=1
MDSYQTLDESLVGEGYYSEKRSKFLAYAHHVDNVEQAKAIIAQYRKKYFDARHCCYAYMLGTDGTVFRTNDDGEPSSTAGKPIMGQIVAHGLTNVLICVIRYYGGVNLGTGGLIVAYRTAALDAIKHSKIVTRLVEEQITFRFTYPMMNGVMGIVKDMQPKIVSQSFDNDCEIVLAIRKSKAEELRKRLDNLSFCG